MPTPRSFGPIHKHPHWLQVYATALNEAWGSRGSITHPNDALDALDRIKARVEMSSHRNTPLPVKRDRIISPQETAWGKDEE